MRKAETGLCLIFGLFWTVFGLNGFLHFFAPPKPSGAAASFMQALDQAGYIMPLVYTTQVITGLMFLTRRFVPLALLALAPVIANIMLYDLFLNRSGLVIGTIIVALYVVLLWQSRKVFIIFLTKQQKGNFS